MRCAVLHREVSRQVGVRSGLQLHSDSQSPLVNVGAAKHRVRQDKIVPLSLSVLHGPLRQRWAIRGPGWGPACQPAAQSVQVI